MDGTAKVILEFAKTCKSCVQFKAPAGKDLKVTTSLYLLNDDYEALGKPDKIQVVVSVPA